MIIMLVIPMMMSIKLMLDDYQMLPWLLILTLKSSFGATKAGYFFRSGSRTNLKKGATIDSGRGNWLVFHFLTSSSAPSVANFLQ